MKITSILLLILSLVMGLFLVLILNNSYRLHQYIQSQSGTYIFLKPSTTADIQSEILNHPELKTQKCSLQTTEQTHLELKEITKNTALSKEIVKFVPGIIYCARNIKPQELKNYFPEILEIESNQNILEEWSHISFTIVSATFILLLVFILLFFYILIFYITQWVQNKKDEIHAWELVGATPYFIQKPLFIELSLGVIFCYLFSFSVVQIISNYIFLAFQKSPWTKNYQTVFKALSTQEAILGLIIVYTFTTVTLWLNLKKINKGYGQ